MVCKCNKSFWYCKMNFNKKTKLLLDGKCFMFLKKVLSLKPEKKHLL